MTNNAVTRIVQQLLRIARLNKDEFRFSFLLSMSCRRSGLEWVFECHEVADGHCFCMGSGSTPEQAVSEIDLKDVCDSWGYVYVE